MRLLGHYRHKGQIPSFILRLEETTPASGNKDEVDFCETASPSLEGYKIWCLEKVRISFVLQESIAD